ncbi:hypothetical protein E4T38_06572 [Aureobasidium subglaciale]|nr:hypothetical protein E4T38_06572 [Aureobasidium subglaciale]KAI5218922.1 hypothetical protein E4T40_06691 [Aureobasidium subglaciale]KAI5222643.1 hypothetical protein E4T41_06512 [Aureobasidium subglaciale]KAI5260207.1 hypothetical protein E4T46_06224 [Aureobasidium subglaciale]
MTRILRHQPPSHARENPAYLIMADPNKNPEPKSSPEMAPTTPKTPRRIDDLRLRESPLAAALTQNGVATTTTSRNSGERPSLDSPFSPTALFDHGHVDPDTPLAPAHRRHGFNVNMVRAQMSTSVLGNAFRDGPPVAARVDSGQEAHVEEEAAISAANDRQIVESPMPDKDDDEYDGDVEDVDEEFVDMEKVAERMFLTSLQYMRTRALERGPETREREYSPGRPEKVDKWMARSSAPGGDSDDVSAPAPQSDPESAAKAGADNDTVWGPALLTVERASEVTPAPLPRGNDSGPVDIPLIVVEDATPEPKKYEQRTESDEAAPEVSPPGATPQWVHRVFDPPARDEAAGRQIGGLAGSTRNDPITPPAHTFHAVTGTVRHRIDAHGPHDDLGENGDVELNGGEGKEATQVEQDKKVDEYGYGEEGEGDSDSDSDSDSSSEDDEEGEGEYDVTLVKQAMADLKR